MIKKYFYCLEVLLIICVITNGYSFVHRSFFRSPFSIIINIATPIAVLIYLLLIIKDKKKLKKKVHEQYQRFFSKN